MNIESIRERNRKKARENDKKMGATSLGTSALNYSTSQSRAAAQREKDSAATALAQASKMTTPKIGDTRARVTSVFQTPALKETSADRRKSAERESGVRSGYTKRQLESRLKELEAEKVRRTAGLDLTGAAELETEITRVKNQLNPKGSLLQAIPGAAKEWAGSLSSAAATLYETGQKSRTLQNEQMLEHARADYDRIANDLRLMEDDNRKSPGTWNEKTMQGQRNMLAQAKAKIDTLIKVESAQRGATKSAYSLSSALSQSGQKDIESAKKGRGQAGQFMVDIGVGLAQLAADITAGVATGGGATIPLALRSFGGKAQEVREEGHGLDKQVLAGASAALLGVLSEKISSVGKIQTKAFGSGPLDEILEGVIAAVEDLSKDQTGRNILNRLASAGMGFLSEGSEELLEGAVQPILDKLIYSEDPLDLKQIVKDSLYSFLVGGVIGSVTAGKTDTTEARQRKAVGKESGKRVVASDGREVSPEEFREAVRATVPSAARATDEQIDKLYGVLADNLEQERAQSERTQADVKRAQEVKTEVDFNHKITDEVGAEVNEAEEVTQTAEQMLPRVENPQLVRDKNWRKAHLSSKDTRRLDAAAKVLGVEIRFAETVDAGESNAKYENGVITLALDAKDPVMTSVIHEAVHRIREIDPDVYNGLSQFVQTTMSDIAVDSALYSRSQAYGTDNTDTLTEEMVADAFGRMLGDTQLLDRFVQDNRNAAEKILDVVRDVINSIKRVLADQNRQLENWQKEAFRDLRGDLQNMERLFTEAMNRADSMSQTEKNTATKGGEGKKSFKGYDPETGRGIYEGNFPKNTPKTQKAARILGFIQNVWSKKPIDLIVRNTDGTTRTIKAQFDPTYDENPSVKTDASKLMGGNRHGTASERRVTLDLADDYYQIASEASFNYSKPETGKESETHKNVNEWHYFINDILYREHGEKETAPYRVTVNVKERSDGSFVYSFNAERQDERSSTRQTLHADVTPENSGGNAQPSDIRLPHDSDAVKQNNGHSSKNVRDDLDAYIAKYGALPKGERPVRDIQMPKKTSENEKVSQTVRTILEAGATPDAAVPTIEEMVAKGEFSYEVHTDKQAMADADTKIRSKGYASALADWTADVRAGKVSKANTAMGWALYNNAANAGDIKAAMDILADMVAHQRNAAQAVQATRILKKLSPEAQLYGVQRSVENLKEELEERYGDATPDIHVNEDLARKFLEAKSDKERDKAMRELYRDIGRQMPSRFVDKWNAWRYLAMLGNPRTHVRNVVGNAFFAPVVATKNLTATAIEAAVSGVTRGKIARTKGIPDRKLLKAAWSDYENAAELIMAGGKYSDSAAKNQYIEEGRIIYRNKALEAARRGNSKALELEDMWFARPHYAAALAQYCKANGIAEAQLAKGEGLDKARTYAIKEAQKATYRDTNAFSQTISELGRYSGKNPVKKGVSTVLEGILPFRKTPANILVRGLEYSPIGLLKSLTYDLIRVQKGEIAAAEAIDNISAGLTGTGLLTLGVYLAAQGLVRGSGGDDEDENEFMELQGHQSYALELPNGTSVTLDWLAPEVLPFFVGVNLYEQARSSKEQLTMSDILTATANVTEPLLEMSCLQSLNDVFDSVGYASSEGLSALPSALASSATSYLTQGFPTLLGQMERSGEDKRMTTYTEKNAFLTSDMQYTVGRISARLPGVDYQQIPYIDAWGRMESSGGTAARVGNNFLNPAYTSTVESSPMEDELLRLYEQTGERKVLPSRAAKYFNVGGERKDLTAEEYVKYATAKGQTAYDILSGLTANAAYQSMDDASKAEAVGKVYEYANAVAKTAVSDYEPEGWVAKAIEAQKRTKISPEQYVTAYLAQSGVGSLTDTSGKTIDNSHSLLVMEAVYGVEGLSEKQRQQLFDDFGVGKSVKGYAKLRVKKELDEMRKLAS